MHQQADYRFFEDLGHSTAVTIPNVKPSQHSSMTNALISIPMQDCHGFFDEFNDGAGDELLRLIILSANDIHSLGFTDVK